MHAPDIWAKAEEEELQYYNVVADCLAQCAIVFGGGVAAYGEYRLLDLLRWTNRAIVATRQDENE